jgi:D-glycero-alpha-D-manno-heptose-7-phosphate kinase|tara:strand:- start:5843 stop:6829 length:987 start_codon:yes stop_codon:yes gene_type:complete
MIITKTPYRISFFGGGSDYPKWYRKFGGSVLSTTIDKHIYISCRYLPGFFKHKYRIVWSKIENVTDINEIKHHAIKNLLKYLKFKKGLEIHYDGDLPARSGMGSSSSFVVGLMKTIMSINKKKISQQNLGKKAIFFEQNVLNEVVGSQDQIAASVGGLNKIKFNKNGSIKVKKIKQNNNLKILEKNLLLIYTSINRTAHEIASSYVNNLTKSKKKYIESIITHVNEGEKILKTGNIDDFGELLHSSWMLKKKLSSAISNSKIDDLYNHALISGASGGKLLGAGGGGFLLLYMKKKYRKKFFLKSKKLINIPFKFSNIGSEVIYNNFQN